MSTYRDLLMRDATALFNTARKAAAELLLPDYDFVAKGPAATHTGTPSPDPARVIFGHTQDGTPVEWDTALSPHLAVAGAPGSGKSTILANILLHAHRHSAHIEVAYASTLGAHLGADRPIPYFNDTARPKNDQDVSDLIKAVEDEMMSRLERMADARIGHVRNLPDDLKTIIVIVDDPRLLHDGALAVAAATRDTALPDEERLSRIMVKGRSAGIHVVVTSSTHDYLINHFRGTAQTTDRVHVGPIYNDVHRESVESFLGGRLTNIEALTEQGTAISVNRYGNEAIFRMQHVDTHYFDD